jgi:predicted Zn-dependent protease
LERVEYDAPTYRRVINLGTRVAQAMDVQPAGFRYGVLDSEAMNAMVDTKNKTIYVTKGLMDQLNDKELLCVLAHEWAHVTKGHYGKRLQKTGVIDALSTLAAVVNPVGMIAATLINPVAKKSFTRVQEEEADSEAANTLNGRMKISPYACVSAFKKLKAYVEKTGGREQGGLLDSHPSLEARITRLKQQWPDKPSAYKVSLIRVRSAKEAETAMGRLRAGESFGDIASDVSTGVLAKVNRGELGRFEEWELDPKMADAIRRRGGQGIVIFRSAAGYDIVKVELLEEKPISQKELPRGGRAD